MEHAFRLQAYYVSILSKARNSLRRGVVGEQHRLRHASQSSLRRGTLSDVVSQRETWAIRRPVSILSKARNSLRPFNSWRHWAADIMSQSSLRRGTLSDQGLAIAQQLIAQLVSILSKARNSLRHCWLRAAGGRGAVSILSKARNSLRRYLAEDRKPPGSRLNPL